MLLEATEAVGVAERAIELIRQLRELFGGDETLVPAELMRLALLDAEQNLAVLDVARPPRGIASDDERLFAFAHALSLDTLSALLLEWKSMPPVESDDKGFSVLRGRKDWERAAEEVKRLDDHDRLLALARYIVVRGRALQLLSDIPAEVRGALRLTVRLANLRDAHLHLVGILREQRVVEALVRTKRDGS